MTTQLNHDSLHDHEPVPSTNKEDRESLADELDIISDTLDAPINKR